MIFRLRKIGHEDAEAVGERDVVVLVFFDGFAQFAGDLVGLGPILRRGGAQLGHVHVRAHLVMVHVAHRIHGAMLGLLIFFVRALAHFHPGHVVIHVHAGHAVVHSRHVLILPGIVAGFLLRLILRSRLSRVQYCRASRQNERRDCENGGSEEPWSVHGVFLLLLILRTTTAKISSCDRSVPGVQCGGKTHWCSRETASDRARGLA